MADDLLQPMLRIDQFAHRRAGRRTSEVRVVDGMRGDLDSVVVELHDLLRGDVPRPADKPADDVGDSLEPVPGEDWIGGRVEVRISIVERDDDRLRRQW